MQEVKKTKNEKTEGKRWKTKNCIYLFYTLAAAGDDKYLIKKENLMKS